MSSSSFSSKHTRIALGLLGVIGCASATSPLDRSDDDDAVTREAPQALLPSPTCILIERDFVGTFQDAQIQALPSSLYPTGKFGAFTITRFSTRARLSTFRPTLELCYIPDLCAGVVCQATNPCYEAGQCEPSTGQCDGPVKPDGSSCDDGSAAT